MRRALVLMLALFAIGGGDLSAQLRDDPQSLTIRPRNGGVSDDLLSDAAKAELEQRSTWDRVARHAAFTFGFGLVGSGFGYFASQVAYSDWDKINDSTFSRERWNFSLTGAAIGAISGFVLGARDAAREPIGSRLALHQELAGRDAILSIELENLPVTNSYDAVQRLRPAWLVTRGTKQFNETGSGAAGGRDVLIVPGATTIRVYVDNAYFGDVDSLRNLPIDAVRSMEWLEAAEATVRFGSGNTHGAILVSTAQGL